MKTKKRIKIGIATTFVIVILMSLCGSRFVFQKACVRRETSWLNMGTADDYIYNLLVDAYNIRKEKNETVTIKASDGINLVGHYYERDKNAPLIDFFVEMGTSVWGHFCISKADACKAVSQTDIPILIIHGDRDTQAPLSMAYRLYDSCSSEKQLYVVHGANHAENYRKDPEGYENVIAQFVEEHSGALKKEY